MAQSPLFGGGRRGGYNDRLAAQLLGQGSDSSPIQSGWQGAARLAQAIMGGYLANKGEEQRENEQRQVTQGLQSAFAPQFQPSPAGPGPRVGATMAPPSMQQSAQALLNSGNPELARYGAQLNMQDMAARQAEEAKRNDPMYGRANVRGVGLVDLRNGTPNVLLPEQRQQPERQRFMNVPGVGLVDVSGESPRVALDPPRETAQVDPNAGPFSGNSMDAQARNFLLNPGADISSPQYALAYQYLTQPKLQMAPGPDGAPVMSMVTPTLPPNIRPPVFSQSGAQPAPAQAPAASQGAAPQLPPAAGQPAPQAGAPVTVPGATITPLGTGRPKDLSEAQAKANLFGGQMVQAENILSGVQVPSNASLMAWRNLPEGAVNMVLPENDQKYFNALRLFASGVLRKETGAAFTANELLDVQSRFFPMPGDTAAVREQKAQARRQVQESIRTELPGGEFRGIVSPPVYGSQDMQGGGSWSAREIK
jgi:hypothetical protein